MSAHTTTTPTSPILSARLGLTSRIAATGAMAGGVLAGGVLVAALTMDGRMSGFGLLHTSTALFLVGALLGFVLAAALGVVGREAEVSLRDAVHGVAQGALYSILGLPLAWLLGVWVALSVVAGYLDRPATTALVAAAWIGVAFILQAALRLAFRSARNVARRLGGWRVVFPTLHAPASR